MEKFKVGDKEYQLIPIPPGYSPHSTLMSNLMKRNPENVEDADKIRVELDKVIDALFKACVVPNVEKEHRTSVVNALMDLTNKTIEEAKFFRKPKQPNDK